MAYWTIELNGDQFTEQGISAAGALARALRAYQRLRKEPVRSVHMIQESTGEEREALWPHTRALGRRNDERTF